LLITIYCIAKLSLELWLSFDNWSFCVALIIGAFAFGFVNHHLLHCKAKLGAFAFSFVNHHLLHCKAKLGAFA
jgi:hypothetical protein